MRCNPCAVGVSENAIQRKAFSHHQGLHCLLAPHGILAVNTTVVQFDGMIIAHGVWITRYQFDAPLHTFVLATCRLLDVDSSWLSVLFQYHGSLTCHRSLHLYIRLVWGLFMCSMWVETSNAHACGVASDLLRLRHQKVWHTYEVILGVQSDLNRQDNSTLDLPVVFSRKKSRKNNKQTNMWKSELSCQNEDVDDSLAVAPDASPSSPSKSASPSPPEVGGKLFQIFSHILTLLRLKIFDVRFVVFFSFS